MHILIYLLFLFIGSTVTLFIRRYRQPSFLKEFHKEEEDIFYLKKNLEEMLDELKVVGSNVIKEVNEKREFLEKLIKEADQRIEELNLDKIARKLNMNKGEIELILKLYHTRVSS